MYRLSWIINIFYKISFLLNCYIDEADEINNTDNLDIAASTSEEQNYISTSNHSFSNNDIIYSTEIDVNNIDDNNGYITSSSENNIDIDNINIDSTSDKNINKAQNNPEIEELRNWAIQCKIPQAHLDSLLNILRKRLLETIPKCSHSILVLHLMNDKDRLTLEGTRVLFPNAV